MNDQLMLFNEPNPAVLAAIDRVSGAKMTPPNFIGYTQRLGSLMMTLRPGSIILAAIPNACAADRVCEAIEKYCREWWYSKDGQRHVAIVDLPHAASRRDRDRLIVDAYSEAPVSPLARKHQPQFELGFMPSFLNPAPVHQICGIISNRAADVYVVRNAHYLGAIGANLNDGINSLRFFIELAHRSRKTHVLFARLGSVSDWMASAEIAEEVTACWLPPYTMKEKASFLEFKSILNSYDNAIPRVPGFQLLTHAKQIFVTVWGCPYRLNKWVHAALAGAVGRKVNSVTWTDFVKCAPSNKEREHAQKEFTAVELATAIPSFMVTPTQEGEAGASGKNSKKPKIPVGERKLGRDTVGQTAA